MDIPIKVDVFCRSELCGRSTNLIVNPVNEKITHLVVAEKLFPNIERLVPVEKISATTSTSIELNCSLAEFSNMESFKQADFIESEKMITVFMYQQPYAVWPYGMYEAMPMPLEHKHIPAGEVAIHRGTEVKATDGQVGRVDEFLVNPKTDVITHLVLREGHLWGQKDVTIPVSEIDKIDADAVYLKIDKKAVEELPAISVKRKWK
jgi:sporulation protein YlmC with PRC-barrel domain